MKPKGVQKFGRSNQASRRRSIRNFHQASKLENRRVEGGRRADWRSRLFSIFVGNLHEDTSLGVVWKHFSEFGVVVDAFIPANQDRKGWVARPKYAFVRYRKEEEARAAIEGGNGNYILNRSIRVRQAKQGGKYKRGIVNKEVECESQLKDQGGHLSGNRSYKVNERSYRDVVYGKIEDLNRMRVSQLKSRIVGRDLEKKPEGAFWEEETSSSERSLLGEACMDVTIPHDDMDWLMRSVVGHLSEMANYKTI